MPEVSRFFGIIIRMFFSDQMSLALLRIREAQALEADSCGWFIQRDVSALLVSR